ncbi:MAG: hypothetical protein NTZ97_04835 [Candidatus Moranbacteria bacterium]|nr:hypothetical protein [Candidatus Moranbacteria bacterium]
MKKEKIKLKKIYEDIISLENLLEAWKEFVKGKRDKKDVQEFSMRLMDNIFLLHSELLNHTYKHGGYQAFKINDPKPFIADSYSCRNNKGTHKAINRFRKYSYIISKNNTKNLLDFKMRHQKVFREHRPRNINQNFTGIYSR